MNGYGPNVDIPTDIEADRDMHEHDQTCTFATPCPACRRQFRRTGYRSAK